MNDEELIQRLRRTLRDRADGLDPAPAALPSAEAAPRSGQTSEYPLIPPAVPPRAGGGGRRWPPVVGIGVVVAAAAAASVAVAVSDRTHPVTVPAAGHGSVPAQRPAPMGSTPTAPSNAGRPSVPPASTVPMGPAPVPAGFRPESVTFVSPQDGWVVGSVSGPCPVLARTSDGGRSWWEATGPAAAPGGCASAPSSSPAPYQVRFADDSDGWVWTAGAGKTGPQLWSTHDGGATWTADPLPLVGATVGALEASGGHAHMVVYGPCPAGRAGCQGQTVERILTTPVGSDDWRASPLSPSIGAGPVLSPALTLWGSSGWLVNNNRDVVSGASLSPTRGWTSWTPPCTRSGGSGLVAAASANDLVAVCAEGVWGTPDPGTTAGRNWLFRSSDGGRSFTPVGPLPGNQPSSVTTPPDAPGTVVVADGTIGLQATFDGGSTWTTLEPGPGPTGAASGGYEFDFVGFTTATQGVAVATQPAPAVLMTRDGGHTWNPVSL